MEGCRVDMKQKLIKILTKDFLSESYGAEIAEKIIADINMPYWRYQYPIPR